MPPVMRPCSSGSEFEFGPFAEILAKDLHVGAHRAGCVQLERQVPLERKGFDLKGRDPADAEPAESAAPAIASK